MPPTPQTSPDPSHIMQCMEVWGGNRSIDAGVSMSGIDAWVYSKPYESQGKSDAGGGDIHYLSSCMTGRISRMLVADVSGHGAAVDSVAVNLRDLMRKYVNFLDQSRFVENLNVQFGTLSRAGLFATALVATYWAPTEHLVATNAGHPRPLLYRASRRSWEYLESNNAEKHLPNGAAAPRGDAHGDDGPTNLPLGVLEPTNYDQFAVRLRDGDLVLIYTDSLLESRGKDGKLLGEAGLLELISRVDPTRPAEFVRSLVAALGQRQGTNEFNDDVTCLLLRRNGIPAKMGFKDIANGIGRILGQALGAIAGRTSPLPWPEIRLETVGGVLFEGLNRRWKGGGAASAGSPGPQK